MEAVKKYLPWTARIIIFGLFMLSGIAKMFPLWMFEKQMVDLGIASWCIAPFLARLIIALELAIAIAILQNHYVRKLVIPITIALLIAFNIHLTIEMVKHGAMNGNCGCFGQFLPMTPLEAFIKNIVVIGILVYLYKVLKDKPKGQNKFSYLSIMYLGSALFMFMAFAHDAKPCKDEGDRIQSEIPNNQSEPILIPDSTLTKESSEVLEEENDEIANEESVKTIEVEADEPKIEIKEKDEVELVKPIVVEPKGPANKTSRFASYTNFNGAKVNLDQGKQIVCLFAAGCDHCQDAAKELTELHNAGILPSLHIIFMDEETFKIPKFFQKAGKQYPYTVVDIPKFWQLLGDGSLTPGVIYMWNGNIQKYYQGTEAEKFNKAGLEKALKK